MELYSQGLHYKLYGDKSSTLKKGELEPLKKREEAQKKHPTMEARQVCTHEVSRFYVKQPGQKTLGYDTNNAKEPC